MTLKQNQNQTFYDSESVAVELDLQSLGIFDDDEFDEPMDTRGVAFNMKDVESRWKGKDKDELSIKTADPSTDFSSPGGQHELSRDGIGLEKNAGVLSSDMYDRGAQKHETCVRIPDRADSNLFTDKHVMPCELPELEILDKKITSQIVGNFCIDERKPENAKLADGKSLERTNGGVAYFPENLLQKNSDLSGDETFGGSGKSSLEESAPDQDPPASQEKDGVSKSHGLRYNSEIENESITFNFKSPEPVLVRGDEIQYKNRIQSSGYKQQSQNGISEDHSASTDPTVPRLELLRNTGNAGDISFSAAHSGTAIPFSGSISLRSDASTTSTRSFAFPILQSEWNSSPVRMRRGDGNFRKQKRWRTRSLLCCRF